RRRSRASSGSSPLIPRTRLISIHPVIAAGGWRFAVGASEVVGYEVRGRVALITIERPEKRNAISAGVALELQAAWGRFEAGEERVAVIAGEGGDRKSTRL